MKVNRYRITFVDPRTNMTVYEIEGLGGIFTGLTDASAFRKAANWAASYADRRELSVHAIELLERIT